MAAKNTDEISFNRSGLFDYENMTITYEDKNGIQIFDLNKKLQELNGHEVSIGGATKKPAVPDQ